MRHSLGIKNLTIALEALSRIPGVDAESIAIRIRGLLGNVLTEEEHSAQKRKSSNDEDEIPF